MLNLPDDAVLFVLIQLAGALYLAFALANWTAKGSMIGGIYSRPLAIGNLLHFTVSTLTLLEYAFSHGLHWPVATALAIYALFAALFTYLVFGFSPTQAQSR
jgi:hypothetical protein